MDKMYLIIPSEIALVLCCCNVLSLVVRVKQFPRYL